MIKAIVFDFDGVIADTEPLHFQAFQKLAAPWGITFDYDRYLRDFVGFDDRDLVKHLFDDALEGEQLLELTAKKQTIFDERVEAGVEPYPGVGPLLDELADMPIAIASGATRRDIDLVLGGLGWRGRFEVIVTADDVARSKPDPMTYARAVEQLNRTCRDQVLLPGHCLAIEDTATGIRSAKGAGLPTLAVAHTCDAATLAEADRVEPAMANVTLAKLRQWFS